MAPPKTKYPKKPRDVHIEDAIFDFAILQTRGSGDCFHDKKGSFSEFGRRAIKSYILNKYPSIKNNTNMTNVDWGEAY
jgi:hypothetical protein